MKKQVRGWIINELVDGLISLMVATYVHIEKAIQSTGTLFLWIFKKIKPGYTFCVLLLSSVRENFMIRDKVKQP